MEATRIDIRSSRAITCDRKPSGAHITRYKSSHLLPGHFTDNATADRYITATLFINADDKSPGVPSTTSPTPPRPHPAGIT
ncbi:hypothetical protein GWI33_016983 [Rhynchophorus ferrugineus]|uniref:Uncharacterized protein n=1 Tax=Rhynchophorus ferrugineus TaxID=354439 RepID=A0A834M6M3_RHYFE|nr:hypothetical protein GWI33_016983 [Rhynchophorus ferrugineus]